MPAAKELFQRAIVMSGAGIRMAEHERGTKLAGAVLDEVGLKANQLDKLQALPLERLLAAIEPAQKKLAPVGFRLLDRYGFGPVVEGHDLPHRPFDPMATDLSEDVPVMVGAPGTRTRSSLPPTIRCGTEPSARTAEYTRRQGSGRQHRRRPSALPTHASRYEPGRVVDRDHDRIELLAERKAAKGKAPV
jgi:carboxylesterase type B